VDAIEIKAEQAAYWRFGRQMPIVVVEALDEDLLVVSKQRSLCIVEVKISAADLRQERLKWKHSSIRKALGLPLLGCQKPCYWDNPLEWDWLPNYFYFAIPKTLESKAIGIVDELFPYAGLITVQTSSRRFLGKTSEVVRDAKIIHDGRLKLRTVVEVVKAQSASLANAYARILRDRNKAKAE
jgi:hypothetical protein